MTQHPMESETMDAPPPPTYEETVLQEPSSSTSNPVPQPPEDAQRALAPLKLYKSNSGIKGAFVVDIGDNKAGPDVLLKTSNSSIQASIFLRGTVPRPAEVNLETSNSSIRLGPVVREKGQAIHIKATTSNSSVHVNLPLDFDGILALRTSNAGKTLGGLLSQCSVIVPNEDPNDTKTTSYRIWPQPSRMARPAPVPEVVAYTTTSTNGASNANIPPIPPPSAEAMRLLDLAQGIDSKDSKSSGHASAYQRSDDSQSQTDRSKGKQRETSTAPPTQAFSALSMEDSVTSGTSTQGDAEDADESLRIRIPGGSGVDRCQLRTSNSTIRVMYEGEDDGCCAKRSKESSCTIM